MATPSQGAGLWIGNEVVPVLLMGTELSTGGRAVVPVTFDNEVPVVNAVDLDGKTVPLVVEGEAGGGGLAPVAQTIVYQNLTINTANLASFGFDLPGDQLPQAGTVLQVDVNVTRVAASGTTLQDPSDSKYRMTGVTLLVGVQSTPTQGAVLCSMGMRSSGQNAPYYNGSGVAQGRSAPYVSMSEPSPLFKRSEVLNGMSIWTWWRIFQSSGQDIYRLRYTINAY